MKKVLFIISIFLIAFSINSVIAVEISPETNALSKKEIRAQVNKIKTKRIIIANALLLDEAQRKKADEIYKRKLSENPHFAKEIVEEWREDMPENFAEYMLKLEYGCHIVDMAMYDEAVSYLKWVDDKGKGAKWSVDEIKRASGIDFDDKD